MSRECSQQKRHSSSRETNLSLPMNIALFAAPSAVKRSYYCAVPRTLWTLCTRNTNVRTDPAYNRNLADRSTSRKKYACLCRCKWLSTLCYVTLARLPASCDPRRNSLAKEALLIPSQWFCLFSATFSFAARTRSSTVSGRLCIPWFRHLKQNYPSDLVIDTGDKQTCAMQSCRNWKCSWNRVIKMFDECGRNVGKCSH